MTDKPAAAVEDPSSVQDAADGMRFAVSVIRVMAHYQPSSGSHADFITALMGSLMGASIGLIGKEATIAVLEQVLQAARNAHLAAPAAPENKQALH